MTKNVSSDYNYLVNNAREGFKKIQLFFMEGYPIRPPLHTPSVEKINKIPDNYSNKVCVIRNLQKSNKIARDSQHCKVKVDLVCVS